MRVALFLISSVHSDFFKFSCCRYVVEMHRCLFEGENGLIPLRWVHNMLLALVVRRVGMCSDRNLLYSDMSATRRLIIVNQVFLYLTMLS